MQFMKQLLILASLILNQAFSDPMRAVVFGGGPVGLFAATKLREQGYDVTVFEKRSEYTRLQLFAVRNDQPTYRNISNLPDRVRKKLLYDPSEHGTPIKSPITSSESRFYPERREAFDKDIMMSVPFSSIEKTLAEHGKKEGVTFRLCDKSSTIDSDGNITCIDKTNADFSINASNYEILVCADGSNSQCRQRMFPDIKRIHLNKYAPNEFDSFGFNAVIEGQHLPACIKSHLASANNQISAPWFEQHRYRSFITRQGLIYVGITLTKAEYERFKHLNGKTLGGNDPASNELWLEIMAQMAFYRILLTQADFDEIAKVRQHFKASLYPIKVEYQPQNHYAKTKVVPGKSTPNLVALLGDSNFSVHYFTNSGLNCGMRMSAAFVEGLAKYIPNERNSITGASFWQPAIDRLNAEFAYARDVVLAKQNVVTGGLNPYNPATLPKPRRVIQDILVESRRLTRSFVEMANDTTLAIMYQEHLNLPPPPAGSFYEGDLLMKGQSQPKVPRFRNFANGSLNLSRTLIASVTAFLLFACIY